MGSGGPPSHVSHVAPGEIRAHARSREHRALLKSMGARRVGWGREHVLRFRDEAELARFLTALRDAGFAFLVVGHGWYPGDVFADLRDRGLVAGPFQGFSWTTGGWSVRDDPPPPGTPSDPTADP
ncbi:MAG: hypothetical protein AMXMBFR53_17640 [Gemmatimonadota bacterium]